MKLKRYEKNPIIKPNSDNDWESLITTNPTACYDESAGKVFMLYRAAGNDFEHKIYLGLAESTDGYDFKRVSDKPVFGPSVDGFDAGGIEDPRMVKIGDYFYITYAARPIPPRQYWLQPNYEQYIPEDAPADFPACIRLNKTATGLAITKDFKSYYRAGRMTDPAVDDRDVILFPEKINNKYYMFHRPIEWVGEKYGTEQPAMWIASGNDMLHMRDSKLLITPKYDWECKIGGNTPPIRTDKGWFTLYHATGDDKRYRLGALLLDLDDPSKVLHRTSEWLIQPEEDYEINGIYKGVIFPCGSVVINNTLFVYYGGADKYVGLATVSFSELLNYLQTQPA